jgi:elongation factor G
MRVIGASRWLNCRLLADAKAFRSGARELQIAVLPSTSQQKRLFSHSPRRANAAQDALKKAQEDAASLTPEYIAANMDPKEAERLSRVRNIGIAVRNQTMIVFSPRR